MYELISDHAVNNVYVEQSMIFNQENLSNDPEISQNVLNPSSLCKK